MEKRCRNLNSLIVFAHVVDANAFSKTAGRLKMPASTREPTDLIV